MCCVSVVSGRHAAEILETAKHPLDGVAFFIEKRGETILPFSIGFGRDVGHRAEFFDLAANSVGVITFVAVQHCASGKLFEKFGACCAVGDVATGKHKCDWTTQIVGQRVDFCCAPAA